MKKFTERFRQLTSGKSVAEIVNETKISEEHIYGLVEEIKNPNDLELCNIADVYNVTVDYLLGRTEEKEPAQAEAGQAKKDTYHDTNNIAQSEEVVKNFTDFLPILVNFAKRHFGDIELQSMEATDIRSRSSNMAQIRFTNDGYDCRIVVDKAKREQS